MAHAQLGLGLKFTSAKSSFKRGLQSFTITTKQPATDLYKYIACLKTFLEGLLIREVKNPKGIKAWARFNVLYDKPSPMKQLQWKDSSLQKPSHFSTILNSARQSINWVNKSSNQIFECLENGRATFGFNGNRPCVL